MAVTSHDVARLAGVSQPTVSRALRDDPRVSEATKHRVREAVNQLGYVPIEAGRALSSGRTRRIGLLVTDLDNQFYSHIIAPTHRELERLGYQLLLHTESADSETIADRLIANGLDGVILATTTAESVAPLRLHDRGVPFVYFNRTAAAVDADSTVVSPVNGLTAAVTRAVDLGHRRIGAILGPSNTSTAQGREVALRTALAEHGLALEPDYVRRGPFDTESGALSTASLLALPHPPTVIFCGNDVVAYGALNAARGAGVPVPDGISIIGFDDLPPASWPILELTTIAYDLVGMASAAAGLITRRIEQPDAPISHIQFETSFVERGTLAAPAAR
ncbi:LacI family DNA-binding transcriptional regulator [Microbacterium rhizosphaerae]|uniref:LacI family DNA-binding transcriptional regulator n=1 Tax=Microbacterium rhizosphaerae TaxID=1678237 RepID=A0ABZ0SQA8_9MICO|nr:LacI family DNA-binding transcriptional regulator [Microbacterium rhizosphaerae]WPR89461.1 LacI family DNA-binding transcriptional regulator [Microbacterium rhizosphaerae]